MLQCTDGTIYDMTLQEAKSIARHLGLTLRTKHKKGIDQSSKSRTQGEATNNRN